MLFTTAGIDLFDLGRSKDLDTHLPKSEGQETLIVGRVRTKDFL